MARITTAVVPAAGLGSRMLPATKATPKELLPAGAKPMIHHVLDEAVRSGITRVCIVIREGKELIRDYFLAPAHPALQHHAAVLQLTELTMRCDLHFVFQRAARGLGDAILQAKDFVGGETFVVMVPDQLLLGDVDATRQIVDAARADDTAIWTSLVRLTNDEVTFFPGARGFEVDTAADEGDVVELGRILSDEEVACAFRDHSYQIRGFGRTVYPPQIFQYLGTEHTNQATGEVDLLRTMEAATQELRHCGVVLSGQPLDLGTFDGYHHCLPVLWRSSR